MKYNLFIILLFVVNFSCKQASLQSSRGIVTREGVAISYQSCGDSDTTLLFVHGWCINKTYWDLQVTYFCPRYRVVTVDLPGFGESGKNRRNWNFDEYTADIKYLIDTLNLKNVVLIGHSMSGDLVLKAGNQYPNSLVGLVGVDNLHEPGSVMDEKQQKETNDFFSMLDNGFDSTVSTYMRSSLFQPSTDSAIVNRVMNDVFTSDSLISTQVLRSLANVTQQEKQLMQGLQHRLYLINSDVLPVKADSLNKYCAKGHEWLSVGSTGHYPMLEKPAAFNNALEAILQKIAMRK